jgi:hypothetical protein
MIFMSGGDQIPVMMVCDSNSGVRLFSRAWPAPTVGAGHARDTLPHLILEFSRVIPSVSEESAVGKIGGKRCHSAKKVMGPPTLTGPCPYQPCDNVAEKPSFTESIKIHPNRQAPGRALAVPATSR